MRIGFKDDEEMKLYINWTLIKQTIILLVGSIVNTQGGSKSDITQGIWKV